MLSGSLWQSRAEKARPPSEVQHIRESLMNGAPSALGPDASLSRILEYSSDHLADTRPRNSLSLSLSPEVFPPLFAPKWKASQINSSKTRTAGILSLRLSWDTLLHECPSCPLCSSSVNPVCSNNGGWKPQLCCHKDIERIWKLVIILIFKPRAPNHWAEIVNNVPRQ